MCTFTRILTLIVLLLPAAARAQTPPGGDTDPMALENLLRVEVVSTASKFPQEVREAPASINVITAADIRRYGHRTLGDVLSSVRGIYTSYDRIYAYLGVRGFSRPGDYNTRVLLLLDGHRLNDGVYDMAPIGTEFPIDVSLIDRVEVIRGPASSLYGTNAFFAVINIVTRTGAQQPGLRAELYGGSLHTRGATVTYGRSFDNHGEVLVATSHHGTSGVERLHFPEFGSDEPGSGIAVGQDGDRASNLFASAAVGRFSLRAGAADRYKHVPTAAFGAVFGDRRFTTTDSRAYLSAAYDGPLGRGWSANGRLGYDYYRYKGIYPYDYGEPAPVLYFDRAEVHTVTGELTARRRIARSHLVTVGTEIRRHVRNRQWIADGFYGPQVDVQQPGTIAGVYAQDEIHVFPWMIVNGGVRVDRYSGFSSEPTPRAGLVLLPRKQTAFKILHGRAFRAPNNYELYYYDAMREGNRTLDPERIQSTEVVWEEYVSARFHTAVTAFTYTVDRIIEQRGSGDSLYFANISAAEGRGIEAEFEAKLPGGWNGYVSQAFIKTHERGQPERLSNSPRWLSKFGVQIPLATLHLAVEGQYVAERLTQAGQPLKGAFVPNLTLTSPEGRRLELSASLHNFANTRYANPAAQDHVQQAIVQDGRTFLTRVRVRF